MINAIGYANHSAHGKLKPFAFERKEPTGNEVQIDIQYCGVCHSDVHQAKDEWKNTNYPCLPGHEIVGKVVRTGPNARKFKVGDLAGVGCMISSCGECPNCREGLENYCDRGPTATYNGNMVEPQKSDNTFGGYSNTIVVREDFALRIPPNLDPAAAAPILCAGVTTFSPLRHWGVKKGTRVGVIGLGGLGHMAVKIAVAMGAEVTVITTSPEKSETARKLGAKSVIVSKEKKEMEAAEKSLDFILSTVPETHDVNPYLPLLKRDGVLTIVGCLQPLAKPLEMTELIMQRRSIGTSVIGGIRETQDVLDFCAQYGVAPDIRKISIDQVNDAFDSLDARKADFRYVIDLATLNGKQAEEGLLEKIGGQIGVRSGSKPVG